MPTSVPRRLKVAARAILSRTTAPILVGKPLGSWPSMMGYVHDISIPSAVVPLPAPTSTCAANIKILLELLDRVRDVPGAIAECGVFRGGTLVPMALHLRQTGANRRIYGFDSFEGFGDSIAVELTLPRTIVDPQMHASGFTETSRNLVETKLRRFGLTDVRLVTGYFETTLSQCPETQFAFAHLDGDSYDANRTCLEYFYPRMSRGGVVVFDEYNDAAWPGCTQAVDEFMRTIPERLMEINRDNFVKAYFVKE